MTGLAETTVGRLRVRARAGTDPRAHVDRVLGAVSAAPGGLAPSAILCLRRLADPRPGTLRLEHSAIRPPPEWERALEASLDRELREAVRPALGAVPATANAVLFADRAELLACLTADWLSGQLAGRWWWTSIVPNVPAALAVRDAWRRHPEQLPAAVELLAARGRLAAFARALEAEEAKRLAVALARVFGLPALEAAVGAVPAQRPPEAPAPWRAVAPALTAVAPPVALLLGVALLLRRAPREVRAPAFAAALHAWVVAPPQPLPAERAPVRPEAPPVDGPGPAPAPATIATATSAEALVTATATAAERGALLLRGQAPSTAREQRVAERPPSGASPRAAEVSATPPAAPASEPRPPAVTTAGPDRVVARARTTPRNPAAAPAPRESAPGAPAPVAPPARSVPAPADDRPAAAPPPTHSTPGNPAPAALDAAPQAPVPEVVATELGGLFFLVNVALELGLIADFSAPADPGAGLDPWDLVTLVGHELLDDREDPAWGLLAALACRDERVLPARGVDPGDWRVPPEWLTPWPQGGEWTWSAARGWVRLRHPAGFVVVETRGGRPEDELARYGAVRARAGRVAAVGGRPAVRWARRFAGYLRPRLGLALGAQRPEELLLERPARVHVTPAHVDVEFALAAHPLEIRLAGLDRDPGFIPAAGRSLAFHFR